MGRRIATALLPTALGISLAFGVLAPAQADTQPSAGAKAAATAVASSTASASPNASVAASPSPEASSSPAASASPSSTPMAPSESANSSATAGTTPQASPSASSSATPTASGSLSSTASPTATISPKTSPTYTRRFKDVPTTHPFFREIAWLESQGITTGWADGTFRPTDSVSRGAFAAFLYRMSGKPAFTAPATSPFTDVPTTHPFYREISWLSSVGVTTGWPDGTFRPEENIARDAMAAFMYRYACKPEYLLPEVAEVFTDVPAERVFAKEISWMRDSGLSTGWEDGSYRPLEATERGAIAAFLSRFDAQRLPVVPTCRLRPAVDAVTVKAKAVTVHDESGTAKDTFTVPSVKGVEYRIDGEAIKAGTYSVKKYFPYARNHWAHVALEAVEVNEHYILEGASEFTHDVDGRIEVRAAAPSITDKPGRHGDTFTIPESEGVAYDCGPRGIVQAGTHRLTFFYVFNAKNIAPVTITAVAKDGYKIVGQSTWKFQADGTVAPLSFDEDPAYASIEAEVTLQGSGSGYHAKLVLSDHETGLPVSFGVQYEKDICNAYPHILGSTAFLIENVKAYAAEAGPRGKEYLWIEPANIGQKYKIRLSFYPETSEIAFYVNDREYDRRHTVIDKKHRLIFTVEGSAARAGDTVDATFENVRLRAGDSEDNYGTIGEWNDADSDYFGLDAQVTKLGEVSEDGQYSTMGGHVQRANMKVVGTATLPVDENSGATADWDETAGMYGVPLSGQIKIAQQFGEKAVQALRDLEERCKGLGEFSYEDPQCAAFEASKAKKGTPSSSASASPSASPSAKPSSTADSDDGGWM